MSLQTFNTALDLLGQRTQRTAGAHLGGPGEPQLAVAWGEFHQGAASNLRALFRGKGYRGRFQLPAFFRECWIESRIPRRAILAAALLHTAFVLMPRLDFPVARPPAFAIAEITWTGPIDDLPLVSATPVKPAPSPRNEEPKPASEAADAFHPRQRIFTDPAHPNHPRQMLVRPDAPAMAPKILPSLPNVVELAAAQAPARPKIEIDATALRALRPRDREVTVKDAVAPQFTSDNARPAEMNLAMPENAPARPKLEINASAAPRAAARRADENAGAAPQLAAGTPGAGNSAETFIALSATPAPPAAVQPPAGNLAARIAISPEGKRGGAAGSGVSDSSAGPPNGISVPGISISGGNPQPKTTMSGLGGRGLALPPSRSAEPSRAERASSDEPPARRGPPNFADLPPGARPERIFASKRVYTLHVNMPNLNSATGSWILNFSELMEDEASRAPGRGVSGNVTNPVPLHKVDPKYPPTLVQEHVEGEVVLYAIIRRDGSVDSIQLVHGLDEQLDANSIHALSEWRFRPATKGGEPIDLEAIVHIPFRAPEQP